MKRSRFRATGIIASVLVIAAFGSILISYLPQTAFGQQKPSESQNSIGARTAQEDKLKSENIKVNKTTDSAPTTAKEARIRARILHESFAGALQVMHRDYFREGQRLKLPSQSLEDVFKEMAKTHGVKLRWLAVNANAMSVNHKAQNSFEEQVVKELSSGKEEFEMVSEKSFQYAGSIRLSASCVKCHVRGRTSNAEKKAALVIKMPLRR